MNPRLQRIQQMLRASGTLRYVEQARFHANQLQEYSRNRNFVRLHPDFALPPAHLRWDAYGHVSASVYRDSGLKVAERLVLEIDEIGRDKALPVLEWGCGPARVIRHLPSLLGSSEIYGSDYNAETILWCKRCIPNVNFVENALLPPLPFPPSQFGLVYALSVFTHLSEASCMEWIEELKRVIKKDAVLILTTHSDLYSNYLLPAERESYDRCQFVVRAQYREGKKMYLAFHPPQWVRTVLLNGCETLKHYPGGFSGTGQDVWVVRVNQ